MSLSLVSPLQPPAPTRSSPPPPVGPILLPPLPNLFLSLNARHFCNRGTAPTAPFYPRLFSHPFRVLYPALRSPVSLCSTRLEGCPTNTACLSAPFSSPTAPPFVAALIQGLLPPSSQGLAPLQRRGVYLCLHPHCAFLTTRVHHLHIESIGVVRPWTVPYEDSFTSKVTMQPLMMAMTPLLRPTVARSSPSGVH